MLCCVDHQVIILDALSATGLRSIRYALECTECAFPIEIISNDISKEAITTILNNVKVNQINNVIVNHDDARYVIHLN